MRVRQRAWTATPEEPSIARAKDISIEVGGRRRIRAHLALPDAVGEQHAGVLVLHEILGLNDDIRRIAARFADQGYAALAPDIFDGLGPMPICIVRTVAGIARGHGRVVDDMLAARDRLAEHPEVLADRIGLAGFCMGGGFALLLGTIGDFRAAAPYYGEVAKHAESYRGICPVVAGYGARDLAFGAKAERLASHLRELGVPHDVKVYENAGHSYMSRHARWQIAVTPFTPFRLLRPGYVEDAAEDSWKRMLAFFDKHVRGES